MASIIASYATGDANGGEGIMIEQADWWGRLQDGLAILGAMALARPMGKLPTCSRAHPATHN